MFEGLTARLNEVFKRLTGKGRLSEEDVAQACREIRLALLEADVHFKVVKDLVDGIRRRAVGQEVLQSLTPGQQVVKIVHEEMIRLLGSGEAALAFSPPGPTVFMLVGLQGGGKTTTAGKFAGYLKSKGHQPLLAATDVRRPAAIEQLKVVGSQVEVPVFDLGTGQDPVDVARGALARAKQDGLDLVILDTGGRLHVDEPLMDELRRMKAALQPAEILLVVDAMTGQDAVNAASQFDQALDLTGFILTKLDGDARGGAALSIRAVTGKPIKFAGIGERLDAIEVFHPERMASRILGMGDVLTLIEKAEATFSEEQAAALERKLRRAEFDLNDFMEQLQHLKRMGPLDQVLEMIPGMARLRGRMPMEVDPAALVKTQAIIQSMTPQERADPDLIDGRRRRRIAQGSGTSRQDVNALLAQFKQMKQMFRRATEMEKAGKKFRIELPIR